MRTIGALLPLLLLAAIAAGGAPGRILQPRSLETIDLMPLFWAFRARAQGEPIEQQVSLFREMVIARRPQVYNAEVLNTPGGQSLDSLLPAIYPKAAASAAEHHAALKTLSSEIATSLPWHEAAFRREFPDYSFAGPVYFMYSLGAFDGAVRNVEGRRALLLGLDVIAAVHGAGASVGPLFHHERFHLYHDARVGVRGPGQPLFLSLWAEGLATLVSRRLNPAASGVSIFGLPTNTPARVSQNLPVLAAYVRERLDSRSPDVYAMLFLGNEPDAAIPRRSGYFIGYLVADRLRRDGHSLRELARLEGAALRQAMDTVLARPARLKPERPL